MSAIINWLEMIFNSLPLPLLEVWGRFAYIIGLALAVSAYGGFTFKPGGRWGPGREHQAWDTKAVLSIPVTFVLIIATGYIGSFIVLVPGAQTFESLKDLMVFLCVVLFGYPALIAVPFAYGLSDLIEGVPPGCLLDWLPGYFINPACYWVAYQFFGKNPDFRRARTWGWYLLFILVFMSMEPVLWGYICAGKFTSAISFGNITPALFFTTAITWIMAPFAMLAALPLARKTGLFWAEIPGHVKERLLGRKEWVWEAGTGETSLNTVARPQGWPIRMVFLTPFIALVLLMVGATAYATLRSAADDARKLAIRLHEEISANINFQLDGYLTGKPNTTDAVNPGQITTLLEGLPITRNGIALVINCAGDIIASSAKTDDPVAAKAILHLRETAAGSAQLKQGFPFHFDHVTGKPLSREIWLAHATAYEDQRGGHADWIVLTLMPESFYLAGVQTGNSRSAMIFAVALLLSLAVAAVLAAWVTNPLRRISLATQALTRGDLDQHAPGSRMEELNTLAHSFNDMAGRLKKSFDHLNEEITERKLAERKLQAGEELLRHFIKHTPAAVAMFDANMCYLQASDRWIADYHLEGNDIIGRSHYEVFPDIPEHWKEVHRRALRGHTERCEEEMFPRADGGVEWLQWEVRPWYAAENVIGGVIFFTQVITERKRKEERFRQIVEANMHGVFFWNMRGGIYEANDAFLKIVGRDREDLVAGRINWMAMTPPEFTGMDERALRELAATGVCEPYEKEYLRKDGSRIPILLGAAVLGDGSDEGVAFVLDLTERKKIEHQLLRSQRMESIGTLAGGIAHDLNNVLVPIIMSLDLMKMKFTDSASQKMLAVVSSSAKRGADMVRQVLSFARGVEGRRMEVQVSHLIQDIEKIGNDTFLKHILVRSHLPARLWTIMGDPTQLHQVLLNLAVNARDAMPGGGTLTLSAENIRLDEHYAALNPEAKSGPYILLQVEDSGSGMPPEIIDKIFDPFFTTKEVGKGTGLGLSTSLGIIKSHGGFIQVYSEPGKGTKFKIYLPARIEVSAETEAASPEMPRGHGELILVVDDETLIRQITRQTLETFGYRVLLANDGADAVAIYARHQTEIALVLTDITMPVMDGAAVIQILKKLNPEVRIIAASGLSAHQDATGSPPHGAAYFLPKPYTAETLLKVLAQVLAAGPPSAG